MKKIFRPELGEVLRRGVDYLDKYKAIFGFTKNEISELYEIYEWVCKNEREPERHTAEEVWETEKSFDAYSYNGVSITDFM